MTFKLVRRIFLIPSAGLGLLASSYCSASEKPNVLFIAIDDLVPTLGCYGDEVAISPRIDGLAAQGMTFLNHHCQWPVCGPSRAALSTGLMPEETGVMGFRPIRAQLPDVVTLPQHFRNNGYETAATGKFHDPRTVGVVVGPDEPTTGGSDTDDVLSWSIPYVKAASGFSPAGKPATDNSDLPDSDYGDHKILTEGLTLVDTLAAGAKPFFLTVGFKKPHLAFIAPKSQWDRYDPQDFVIAPFQGIPANASSQLQGRLDFHNELLGYSPHDVDGLPDTDAEQRELLHGYYACVSFVDSLVGQLLDKLAVTADPLQSGKMLSETTVVVLWGDHGFHLGDHGRWGKHSNIERATLCPLIISVPQSSTAGVKTTSPANTTDLYPTLCQLAGLPIPEQPTSDTISTGRPLKGRSLVPVLEDGTVSVNDGAISLISDSGAYGYSYRTERFRLIEWINSSNVVVARDLFDYERDPLETQSFANDAEYAAVVYQLSRSMRAEPALQGAVRLQSSTPIASGGDGYLPVAIGKAGSGADLQLSWPGSGGVTYEVEHSLTLQAGSWSTDQADVAGSVAPVDTTESQEFFRVTIGGNTPPRFLSDPVLLASAQEGMAYSASLAGEAVDADVGQSLTFEKLSGPSWLTVASNGTLGGMPPLGELCPGYWRVRVNDSAGASEEATIQISIEEAVAQTTSDFLVSDDTFAKATATTLNAGNRSNLELREEGASNFARVAYLKVEVTGVHNIQSAQLFFRSITESDEVEVSAVADITWTESSLNWDNRPASGDLLGSVTAVPEVWTSVDVTSHITGNGTYAFALDEQGNSYHDLYSKEGGFAPYLRVVWQP